MTIPDRQRELRAGAAYFALTFLVGALLGPIRELMLKPLLGAVGALLVEAPLMVLAMAVIAARLVVRFAVPRDWRSRLWMGLFALVLLLVVEVVLTFFLRHITPGVWLAHFWSTEGVISLSLFALFAICPLALLALRKDLPT